MSKVYYSIMVGGREPSKVEVGFLEKTTGLPKGQTAKAVIQVGTISLPNYSKVWGKLIKKGSGDVLTGGINFMKWGAEGGELIEIRYMPNCTSISKLYQDNVVKLKPQEQDAEINLRYGRNDFDSTTKAAFIEMLKHHSCNKDNESRDPENTDVLFAEYNAKAKNSQKTKDIANRNIATQLVLKCKEDDGYLKVLAQMFELDPASQPDDLIEELLTKADEQPSEFNSVIRDRKQEYKYIFETALSQQLIDVKTIKTEILVITRGGKDKLIVDIDEDVKDKIQWVADNCLNPKVFDAITRLSGLLKESEVSMLN